MVAATRAVSPPRSRGGAAPYIIVVGTSFSLWRVALRLAIPSMITIVITICLASIKINEKLSRLEQANPIQQALLTSHASSGGLTTQTSHLFPHQAGTKDVSSFRYLRGDQHQNNWWASQEEQTVEYPVEAPIPNPLPLDGNSTFSACLLVMDDNHRLVEWLAYHFHVLPLRYMIVAVDPRSKTSPTYLFNRWRQRGMYIEEWEDADFWRRRKGKDGVVDSYDLKPLREDADLQTKRDRHRGRQKYFYRSCMVALKQAKRSWVALLDSDEYLVYNHAGGDSFEAWEKKMDRRHALSVHSAHERIKPAHIPPKTSQEGAMIRYIHDEQAAGLDYYQSPCIGIPRLQFGTSESNSAEQAKDVPAQFNPSSFDTLRWRKHAQRNDFVKNALGKVIMDVSRIDIEKSPYFQSLHRPIKTLCAAPWHNDWDSGLRINHYLGSWESYSFRTQDARKGSERSLEQWEYKATTNEDDSDDNIRPWLSGFVESQGLEEAQTLLEGAGLPDWYKPKNQQEWSLLPEKLEQILSTDKTVANDNKMIKFEDWVRQKYKFS